MNNYNQLRKLVEHYRLGLPPVLDAKQSLSESADSDLKSAAAVFPFMRGITLDKLTKNNTNYTAKSAKDSKEVNGEPTGFKSFVEPYGKPVLQHHRQNDGYAAAEMALGRVIWAGYKANPKDTDMTVRPGTDKTYKGLGYMPLVCAVTTKEGIEGILNGNLTTVSIGVTAHQIINSISGHDLLKLAQEGEYDPFYRGQWYIVNGKDQYCYWSIPSWSANEVSYVHVPADIYAGNIVSDIGVEKAQLLLSEKVIGKDEFKFYDHVTKEEVDIASIVEAGDFVWDKSFNLVDSYKPKHTLYVPGFTPTESSTPTSVESQIAELAEMVKNLTNGASIADLANQEANKPKTLNDILDGILK